MKPSPDAGKVLARRTLGKLSLMVFAIGASSPLAVLFGVIPPMFTLGVTAIPLAFVVVGVVFLLVAVGYVAMARHIPHPAPFYALLAHGFGPMPALAGAGVAMLGYNAVQICLYPLIGTRLAEITGTGLWWQWAAAAWLVVAVLGRFRGADNARVLGGLLGLELVMIVLFDVTAFSHAGAAAVEDRGLFAPSSLTVPGTGGVIALSMAALVGAETPPVFSEEARGSRTVPAATFITIATVAVLYAATGWAFAISVGPENVQAAVQDPSALFAVMSGLVGVDVSPMMNLLLITSVLASMTAFHAVVARYVFSMARDGLLPARLGQVTRGVKGGTPFAGSLVQSAIAAVTIAAFVATGADPLTTMFVWLSTLSAVSILLLLTVTSFATLVWFRRGGGSHESGAVRVLLPTAGGLVGGAVLLTTLANLSTMLGAPPGSPLPWLLVGAVIGFLGLGVLWAVIARSHNRRAYLQAGRHLPDQILTRDPRLAQIKL